MIQNKRTSDRRHESSALEIRFYEELNDFLPPEKKKVTFCYHFEGHPSVKDVIEAIGIPHPEVDLILVNGQSVTFEYQVSNNDQVSVYPVFERLDISDIARLRARPLRELKFVLDVHLGTLTRYLRMLGFDSLYDNTFQDLEIIRRALAEKRIILTSDRGLLKNKLVTHGYCVRSKIPREQLQELVNHFDLQNAFQPFCRCLICNSLVEKVEKESIIEQLQPRTKLYYDEFFQCPSCQRIFWPGSHFQKMRELIADVFILK